MLTTTLPADAPAGTLAEAVERNLADLQAHYAGIPGGEVVETNVRWCRTNIPWRTLNGAVLARFSPERVDREIDQTIAYFDRHRLPFRWITGPASAPGTLDERLLAHGLRLLADHPGMVLNLLRMADEPAGPSGLEIHEVDTHDQLLRWAEVSSVGHRHQPEWAAAWLQIHDLLGSGRERPLRNFFAELDGQRVGGAAVYLNGAVAGIYNVVVLPVARNQGIGRALTLACLRAARAAGYQLSTLASSEEGLPVYLRIGYQELCRIRVYVHDAPG